MSEFSNTTIYFAEPGPVNTERTLELAAGRARVLGIQTVLVATTRGETGLRASEVIKVPHLIIVTHSTGFRQPFTNSLDDTLRQQIEANGAHLVTTTHAFGGVGRAVRKKLQTYQVDEIIAFTLRTFGQGMKVAAEITIMAADAGLVPSPDPLIAVAGSGQGADTAAIVLPTHAQTFFDLKFLEIICMPAREHPIFGA